VHANHGYVELEEIGESAGPFAGFPQVAQSTVEMLIIQNPQNADFSVSPPLAGPLDTP
jgi:hypothetical protein